MDNKKLAEQWLIDAIQTSLENVRESAMVKRDKLGAVADTNFIDKVQTVLQHTKAGKAA